MSLRCYDRSMLKKGNVVSKNASIFNPTVPLMVRRCHRLKYKSQIPMENTCKILVIFHPKDIIIHHMQRRVIWHGPENVTKMFINFSISDSWLLRQFMTDITNYYFESDPRHLVTKMTKPTNKISHFRTHKLQKKI